MSGKSAHNEQKQQHTFLTHSADMLIVMIQADLNKEKQLAVLSAAHWAQPVANSFFGFNVIQRRFLA